MNSPRKYGLSYELELLDREPFSKETKSRIREFVTDLEDITEARVMKYAYGLRVVARWFPDKFLNPDKKTIKEIVRKLTSEGYSDESKRTFIVIIRKFYKWYLGDNRRVPEFMEDLKLPKVRDKQPEDLITQQEIGALINASMNPRDKALFSTMYDSGARIGELLSMRIKDLGFDEYGALLRVNGKTGFRQIRIVGNSIPYLRVWVENHPDRNDVNGHLFCGISSETMGRELYYHDVYTIIRKVKRRAGIKRRIHPHLFRHTRATILASKVTEAPLESQMGWVHGSEQTRTYVHLSLRDQDNAILKAYGIKVNDEDSIKEEKPKECPRCHELNPSDAAFCRNCWMPFDIKVALEMEAKQKEIESRLKESAIIDQLAKKLIDKAPENAKIQLLTTILEDIVEKPELLKRFKEELGSKQ